jgi:hypothetical protein
MFKRFFQSIGDSIGAVIDMVVALVKHPGGGE